jgi:hypothetical protein
MTHLSRRTASRGLAVEHRPGSRTAREVSAFLPGFGTLLRIRPWCWRAPRIRMFVA